MTLYVHPYFPDPDPPLDISNWTRLTLIQLFLSDPEAKFSKSIGWADEEGRTYRYVIIIDHGKVTYAAKESAKNTLEVSSADAVYKQL
jgi:peroxiredoxin